MTPLVSIVIPTYNRARDIERALKSVLAQTYPGWEALVVDNHSSDNTDDVVTSFGDPRMKLFKIHNDGVIAASRNLGIRHARGDYVAFLDSDDWWMPEKLEESLKCLDQGADVVYHDLYYASKSDQKIFLRKTSSRQLERPALQDLLVNGNTLGNSSVVVRRVILDKIGGLCEDRDVVTWEDFDAWIRMAKVTEKFQSIARCLGYCWDGGGNALNPARVIANIEAWESRYLNQSSADLRSRCVWASYAKGMCYYALKDYRTAISLFSPLLFKQTAAKRKAKALLVLLLSVLKLYPFSYFKPKVDNNDKR